MGIQHEIAQIVWGKCHHFESSSFLSLACEARDAFPSLSYFSLFYPVLLK
jgi:hypothetical protein